MTSFHKLILTVGAFSMIALAGCNNNNAADERNAGNDNTRNVGYNNENRNTVDDFVGNIANVNDNGNNDEARMTVADEAANRVEQLKEVRRAYVIATENNAYVAAELENNSEGELTREMENRIANIVRRTDTDIENVYVSTNPDFLNRMNNYVNDIGEGRPIGGLFDEFSEAVRRAFPNAR